MPSRPEGSTTVIPRVIPGESATSTLAAILPQPRVGLSDLPLPMAAAPAPGQGGAALLSQMLRETGGNVSECARRLGVDRTTIHRRMRRLGLAARA